LAVNDFNRAIPYYANDTASLIQLYSSLGRSLFKLNNFNDALNAYNHSFSLNPKDSEAYLSITNCYEKLGNYYKAAANCEVGISRWNTNTSMLSLFYSILGNSLPYIGKTGESIEAFNHAISLKSGDPYLYSFRAISYDDTFDYKQAIKDYKSAISLYKDDDNDRLSNWYNNKGIDERLLAKYKNAVKDELKAIAVKPAYAGAYLELGRTYQLMNKKKQAEAAFKKSVQFDSSGSYIFIDAFFLGDSAVAVKTITDKIHSDPVGNLNYDYYTAACLNVLMNKPNEAIMYLKEGMAAGLSKYFVMYDPYFRSIRYTPAFIALMKE
jgi:tetratricopeptide (TPR) repeat protein